MQIIRRATSRVQELGVLLEQLVRDDPRPDERLRHLRHVTGQITRTANDAIQAHRRVAAALRDEATRDGADGAAIEGATAALAEARDRMLEALEIASRQYPWADPWRPEADATSPAGDSERPGG